ncbi:MAG TPA: phosphatase PAP2 family protein [Myxococcales bacterium]|nr:phosphatase PAP2 family protein [Myxococcales bacterium]
MKRRAGRRGDAQNLRRSWAEAASDLIERAPTLLIAAGAALFHLLLYGLANRFPSGPAMLLRETWMDRASPLLAWTSWIYASSHALILTAYWLSPRTQGARTRFVVVFVVTIALSVLIHWALPVRFPRELYPLQGEGLSVDLLRWVREIDHSTSAFPSLHVAMAAAAALQAIRQRLRAAPALGLWALAVALSTLTTKQHYAADVVAGAALAVAVDWAVWRLATRGGAQGLRGPAGIAPARRGTGLAL